MPSFRTQAIIAAHTAALGVHGETITYRRGEQAIADVRVLPGKSEAEVINDRGLATVIELHDWLILSSVLQLDDAPLLPERGDVIELVDGEITLQFAVLHPDGNQAPFRRCDTNGTVLRIHTVSVNEADG